MSASKSLPPALTQHSWRAWLVVVLFLVGLMAAESVAVYQVYATQVPGTADFFARWYGATQLVLEGRNPYDRQIELEAQEILFGRQTAPDEDQVNFAYPLYVIFTFWPLTLVPYAWAQAVWMVVLQFLLILATLLLFDLVGWRPKMGLFIATVMWSIYFYPGARAIMLGQFSVLVMVSLLVCLWALKYRLDWLAGFILPLTTIKPQMVFLVLPILGLWALREKRWRFIAGGFISQGILLLASLIWVPDWPLRFYQNLFAYSGYVGFGSPLENMTARFAPGLDGVLNPLISVVLLAILGWQWYRLLRHEPENLLWVINWTLLVSNLIAFRSATANHVMLYLTMFLLFKRLLPLRTGRVAWGVLLAQVGSSVLLWGLFLTTIDTSRGDNFEAVFMHGLMPTLLILYTLADWSALKRLTPHFERQSQLEER